MKKILLIPFFVFCLWGKAFSQELNAYTATGRGGVATTFATDYQTVGINPANLGFRKSFRDPQYTFGMFEGNTIIFAEALNRAELLGAIFNPDDTRFTQAEKVEAANKMAGSNVSLNLNTMLAGAYARFKGGHNVGFVLRDRIQFFSTINQNAAEIAFLGYNASYFPDLILSNGELIANPRFPGNEGLPPLTEEQQEQVVLGGYQNFPDSAQLYSEILEGSRISSSWFREYNLSYGRQIFDSYDFSLYAGVGAKYISGFLLIDVLAENGGLDPSVISISETYGLDFGDGGSGGAQSPTFRPPNEGSTFQKVFFPRSVGRGYGFDFGLTMVIKQNLYVGMALNNFGRITWDGNVYQVNDGQLVNFGGAGLDGYNFFRIDENAFQFAGDKSPLSWEGTDRIIEELPSTLRLGASYEFFRTFHIGVDIVAPVNRVAGNLEKTLFAIGGDFRPSKIFRISTGFNAGGNNGGDINIPVGITYIARRGFYEAGVATQDISTFIGDVGQGSTFSFALGFLRLKI